MKKMLPIAAVAMLTLTLFSCKKDWTCKCTITPTGGTATTQDIKISKQTKKDADNACKSAQTTYTTALSTASCKLD